MNELQNNNERKRKPYKSAQSYSNSFSSLRSVPKQTRFEWRKRASKAAEQQSASSASSLPLQQLDGGEINQQQLSSDHSDDETYQRVEGEEEQTIDEAVDRAEATDPSEISSSDNEDGDQFDENHESEEENEYLPSLNNAEELFGYDEDEHTDKENYEEDTEHETSSSIDDRSSENDDDEQDDDELDDDDDDMLASLKNLPQQPLFRDGPSVADLTLLLLSVLIKHNATDALKIEIFGALNLALKTIGFPDTQYRLKKLYAPVLKQMQLHIFCKSCEVYAGCAEQGKVISCPVCHKVVKKNLKEENFFFSTDLKKSFKNLLERNSQLYDGTFEEVPSSRGENGEKVFSDVADGSVHLQLRGRFGPNINTFNFFGDAAPAFEASKKTIFSLMVAPNFLCKEDRSRHVKLSAVWVGRKEPPMNILCQPFVKEAARIADSGVDWFDHTHTKRNTKVLPLVAISDTVARAKLVGCAVHNAPYGCFLCYHPNDEMGQAYNRFTVRDPAPLLRSHESWQEDLIEAQETGETTRGVKRGSILSELPGFRIPENVGAEAMHAGDIGHAKALLKLWSANHRNSFYLFSPHKRSQIDSYILNLRLPSLKNSRMMTGVTDFRNWKASQAKIWTLHISLPILIDMQQTEHVAIWARFVSAYWLLSQSSISERDLLEAQRLLEEVSRGHQLLYGKISMTSNLHQTLHWPVSVSRLGPLTEYTAYPYEGQFPAIKRDVSSTKGTSQQIMERALMREALPIAAEELLQDDLKRFALKILEQKNKKRSAGLVAEVRGAKKGENANTLKYHKVVVNGYVVRSFESQVGKKKCDACVRTTDGKIGLVSEIRKERQTGAVSVKMTVLDCTPLIIPEVTIRREDGELHLDKLNLPHIFKAVVTRQSTLTPATKIRNTCFFIERCDGKIFVTIPPNNTEAQ